MVSEAEQVLCRESAEAAQRATKVQEAMDKQFQAQWRQAEAELRDLCKSSSAVYLEHQQLQTAQERQLQFEAQALRRS